jgi:hypothetical protein
MVRPGQNDVLAIAAIVPAGLIYLANRRGYPNYSTCKRDFMRTTT